MRRWETAVEALDDLRRKVQRLVGEIRRDQSRIDSLESRIEALEGDENG